jgi:cell cycle checkpoint control protein RAD9A
MDYFGPGIELLDINTDHDRKVVNFTCFTEKVQKKGANSNEGWLPNPLLMCASLLIETKPF